METAAKIYEEGKKANKDVVQVNPAWVLEESLESLSSKFPILPRSQGSLTFCTTPLSSKLEAKPDDALFDLSDTNVLRYNVLHDPHLKEHFQNPETRRRLFDQGFITEDGYVKCNLVEFNNYRKWIRKLKLEELYKQRRELREEEISLRNTQLMQKKLERETESFHILRVREQKVKEYVKKRREKRDLDRKKYTRLQEIEMRKREKKRKERRNQLDDVEEERERRQVEREVDKLIQEDKKRKIRLRIVRKRRKEDMRRDVALNERRRLGRCQRDRELKNQWKRRCTIALGNITNKWKDEKLMLELRDRNIKKRAKMYQQRQKNNQESVANFVNTRRATLHNEFLEAEAFLNKLRMRKDIEIANWKRKHERMLSRGSSITFVQRKGTKGECLDDYMALRRWSAPGETGFRRRLKSAWDLKSSLIRDLEEESTLLARKRSDLTKEEEQQKEPSKTDVRVKVRSLIKNIISNAQNIFEEEKKRFAVKGLVGGIIDSAVAVVEKEEAYKRNRTCVRRYVFSVIESASQTLEEERREALQAKMKEEEEKGRVGEQMNLIAAELVSAAMVFAKRKVEKDIKEKAAEDDEELKDTAKWIVGTAIERACIRFKGQVQDISRVSSESLPVSVEAYAEEVDYDSKLDWVVRNIVSDAVATAVDSMERLYYEECELMQAATGLMNSAIINAQESLENLHRVTPALEEQINRMAWRLANRALISAENALEKQREESIKDAAQGLASHAILSAQNSFARMEEQLLCDTAEELALQAIMTAQKALRTIEEEEFFSRELATRAILEAKESLVRADEIERTSRELARQAIELAQVSYHNFPKEQADEARKIAVDAAERCIEAYKSQENLTPENDLIATEALKLAIQAIHSSEGILKEVHPRTTCVLTDGKLLSGVMQYVEGIIVRALQELESNKDINVLKPGNIRPDEYNVLLQSDKSLHRQSIKDGTSPVTTTASETAKAGSSSRRRSSVHFNAMNIVSNRRDSLSRESDHLKVRNRPPTPRFLAERSFTNQLACTSWDNLEQKLKHIEKKDRVKVLFSTREGSQTSADRKRLHLRRFSSDQGIAVKRRPVIVSFQVPHSASDSFFRRASEAQDSELVKEMLDSSQESETEFLDTKEHRECEYDTLVSMTNTPEPQVIKDSEVDILQNIRSTEERISCQISPKTSSYILLPKLEASEKVLLQAKVTELEHLQRGAEISLTHLPAVSPTASLVMIQEADGPAQAESETTALPCEEHTNLPKIPKSRSLVSIDRELVTRDVDQERAITVSEAKSEIPTSAKPSKAEGVLVSKPSNEVTPVLSDDVVIEATPKPSIASFKMSPKSSSQSLKTPATEAGKVSPKPSREAAQNVHEDSSKSTTIVKAPSTEEVLAASREKLSPKPSKEKIIPTTSTETAKVSTKTITESPDDLSDFIETEKISSTEAVTISPKPSRDAIKESIESRHSVREATASATETAKLSPIATGESAELSPKVSSVSTEKTKIPSTEAERVSPKSSTEKTAMAEKDVTEAEISVPITLTEECKVSKESSFEAKELKSELSKESITPTPSTETAEVSSKSLIETTRVSPKTSSKSAKITPLSSTDSAEASPLGKETKMSPRASIREAELLPKTSSKLTKKMTPASSTEAEKVYSKSSSKEILLQKDISESEIVTSTTSTESLKVSPRLSTGEAKLSPEDSKKSLAPASLTDVSSNLPKEAGTVSPKASSKSAKVTPTPTPSTVTAALPSKSSSKDVKVLPKDPTASTKMAAIPSSERAQASLKPSKEAARVLAKASATTTSSTAIAELSSKSSGKEVKILTKDSTTSTRITAVSSSEKTEVSTKPSSEAAKLSLKSSSESAKIKPITSGDKAKVLLKPSIEDTELSTMKPVTSTEVVRLSPKSSSEAVKLSSKSSKLTSTTSAKVTHVAPKLSSESVSKPKKMKQVSSREVSSKFLSGQQDKLLPKASSKSPKVTPASSVEDAKMTLKPSSEVKKLLSTTSSGPTTLTPRKSTEAAKLTSRSSSEVASKPSSETAKLPKRSASVSTKMSTKSSSEKTKPPSSDFTKSKASTESQVSPKSSVEATDLSEKVSSMATKMSPKPSKDAVKVSSKPSSEAAIIPSQTSQAMTRMTTMESKEPVKVSPKPSTDSTKMSPSTSTKMVSSPPSDKGMSRSPSRETSKLSTKISAVSREMTLEASSESSNVSSKPSGEAAIVTPKTSTKMISKPSKEETKLSPKRSIDSTKLTSSTAKTAPTSSTDMKQVTAKHSTKSMKLSKKTSTGSTKGKSAHSTEVAEKIASPKPSKISGDLSEKKHTEQETVETTKSSTQIRPPSPEDSHGHKKLTPKASKEDSKLSTKRSRESSIVSHKVSRESRKKKAKHSRTLSKKSSGESDQLTPKPSSQSTKSSPEVSPKASQASQMSSVAPKDSSERVSPRTSRESAKDSTEDKMLAGSSSTDSEEGRSSGSAEKITRAPSRKASKAKHSSQSLTKVSLKTQSQDPTSASASVVSTYVIETPVPPTLDSPVAMESSSSKSLNKLQTQGSYYRDKGGSQEKLPETSSSGSGMTDSQSQLPYKDRPQEEGNRRISLSVPDPVLALRGVGRKTSLPGGAFSEHEFERRRLSSLHDISESKELHELTTTDVPNRESQDQSLVDGQKGVVDALSVDDAENRRLSLVHSIPSIAVIEPSTPPNEDNVLFEEDERVRIISELEHSHPVCSDEQISINNHNASRIEATYGSHETSTSASESYAMDSPKQSKSSIPDIHNKKVSEIIKVHRPSADAESSNQTGHASPKKQSVTCIGIQFSPTSSKDYIPNRASEVSVKTRIAKGSVSKASQENIGVRETLSDSFELKGIGLGGGRSSSRNLIYSRSTEFPRTRPLQVSRGHFSSHSLDTPLSRGVIVTPLKPSPPLSPRVIESSARRSRLKMALSQQRAKETQSETSLTSSKSDPGEASPKKGSETLLGSDSSVSNSLASKESTKTLPERPSTASSMLKREKIKASRTILSSSSSERSDSAARGTSDGSVEQTQT